MASVTITLPASISSKLKPLNLGNYTASLKSSSQQPQVVTGKAIDEIQSMINRLLQANQALGKITVPSVLNLQEVILIDDTQIVPTTAPAVGQALIVFVTQDASGQHKISWNDQFRDAMVSVDQTGGVMTQFLFIGRIDPADTEKQVRWFFQSMWPEILDQEMLLTADTAITDQFQPSAGKILSVVVTQDGTGGWKITWDPKAFDPTTSTGLATKPDQQTRFLFVGRQDIPGDPIALTNVYSSGSGFLNVPDTSIAASIPLPFLLVLTSASTGLPLVTLKVTAIASPTQFTTTPVGVDHNAAVGDFFNFQPRWYLESSMGVEGIPIIFEQEVTLAAPTTAISPDFPPLANTFLTVFVTQDVTGGRALTWTGTFYSDAPTFLDTASLGLSRFLFEGRVDPTDATLKWFYIASFPSPSPTGASMAEQEVTLTADTAIAASTLATVDGLLAVFVTQDGTGGWNITWNPADFGGTPGTYVDPSALAETTFFFVGRTDPADSVVRWFYVAQWPMAPGSGVIFEQEVTLTADTTVNAGTSPGVDELLGVFITQDGTGGWAVTWGTGFASGASTTLDTAANALTTILFIGRLDPNDATVKWYYLTSWAASGKNLSKEIFTQEVTLTASSTVNASITPVADELLVLYITQDGTGGWTPTWGTGFKSTDPTDVNLSANAETRILWHGRNDPAGGGVKWFEIGNSQHSLAPSSARVGITFGTPDDTVATNATGHYVPTEADFRFVDGYITWKTTPGSATAKFDVQASTDNGATFATIFSAVIQVTTGATGHSQAITNFLGTTYPKGTLLRMDITQSGGMVNPTVVLYAVPA